MKQGNNTGLHILGTIYTKKIESLSNFSGIERKISKIIKKNTLQELGSFYYRFKEGGFTGIVSLIESHVAFHTWPEFGFLTLDVYLCNYSRDNRKNCKNVFNQISKIFKPYKVDKKLVNR